MRKFEVTVPIVGTAVVEVEADSESEAIDKAMEQAHTDVDAEIMWETCRSRNDAKLFVADASVCDLGEED